MKKYVSIGVLLLLACVFGAASLMLAGFQFPSFSSNVPASDVASTEAEPAIPVADPDPLSPGAGTSLIVSRNVKNVKCDKNGPCDSILNVYENGNWSYFDMGVAGSAKNGILSAEQLQSVKDSVTVTRLGGASEVPPCDSMTVYRWMTTNATWFEYSSCGNGRVPESDPLVIAVSGILTVK